MSAWTKSWKQHPVHRHASVGLSLSHPAFNVGLARPPIQEPFRITFALDLFRGDRNRELSHRVLTLLLDTLTEINLEFIRANPRTPLLYSSGVRYMEEPPGQEDWQDIPTSLRMGYADCEDLATWRAAELQARGIPAKAVWREQKRPDGSYLYHIVVLWPNGQVEDPSRRLGMR